MRRFTSFVVCLFAAAVLAPAALAAGPVPQNDGPYLDPWAGENSTSQCSSGNWVSSGGTLLFTYEWVLDPGTPGEAVLETTGPTTGADTFTVLPRHVNHVVACRVTAQDGGGTTGPVYAGGPGPFPQSSLVAPLVRLQLNSGQISGDVGGALTGSNSVTVSLRRDRPDNSPYVVDATTVAVNNSTGLWSATLPQHAIGDDRDRVELDFTGATGTSTSSGVPTDRTIALGEGQPEPSDPRGGYFGGMVTWLGADGQSVGFSARSGTECGGTFVCLKGTVEVAGQPPVAATQDPNEPVFRASIPAPVSNDDDVFVTLLGTTAYDPHPTLLELRKHTPLPGVVDEGQATADPDFQPDARQDAACFVSYGEEPSVLCRDVAGNASYALTHKHNAVPVNVYPLTTPPGDSYLSQALTTPPLPGDTLTLKLAGGSGSRELTTTTVAPMRFDMIGDGWASGGSCGAGRWLGDSGATVCPTDGTLPQLTDWNGYDVPENSHGNLLWSSVTSEDDRGGGGTAIHVPQVTGIVPADGAATWGATWQAYADSDLAAFPWSGFGAASIQLRYRPRTSPLSTDPFAVIPGNALLADGVPVSGVPTGRYEAWWVLTDDWGNTRRRVSFFFQQPQTPGPVAATGPQGPAGATGVTGPAGKDGQLVLVAYQASASSSKVTVRYALTGPADITLKVKPPKGATVTAATAKGRSGINKITWNRKIKGKKAGKGTYKLTITAKAGGRTANSTLKITLK